MMLKTTSIDGENPILILLAGQTFPEISQSENDFDEWIAAGLGSLAAHMRMDARSATSFPHPSTLAGVIISGSHSMVTDREPWSERLAEWLKTCVEVDLPVLGICYGHQLLAHAMEGVVGNRPAGIEIGTQTITLTTNAMQDDLFKEMPPTFPAQLVHSQAVLTLPQGAVLLAQGQHEPHQAYRIGKCAWGVQFHPEFSVQAMRGYINQLQTLLSEQERDHHQLTASVTTTPEAAKLLQRFAVLCRQ